MAQPDFKTLKERVGIDDAAYDLGYRVNRQAGVGRFIEMVLPDGSGGHTDSIVISNPKDKAAQYYFRHSAPGSGDVVSFIRENIGRFPDGGRNEWDTVGRVLCRLANEPVPEISSGSYLGGRTVRQEFDPARWETQPMTEHLRNGMAFLTPRGFTVDTLKVFAPHIVRIRDRESQTFRDFNIGFPYREPGGTETVVMHTVAEQRALGHEPRVFCTAECRETASVNCSGSRANLRICGITPQVETVIWRAPMPMPSGELRRRMAASTAS